jgi:hypothetical protein
MALRMLAPQAPSFRDGFVMRHRSEYGRLRVAWNSQLPFAAPSSCASRREREREWA